MMIVVMDVSVLVIIVMVRVLLVDFLLLLPSTLAARLLQFFFKQPANCGILLGGFNLLDLERNTEPFREIALGDGKVSCRRAAGVEVLVIPEKRRRDH